MFKEKVIQKLLVLILIASINSLDLDETLYAQSGWIQQSTGMRNNVSINFTNQSSGYIVGSDGSILKTTNLGLNWNIITTHNFSNPLICGVTWNDNVFMVISGHNYGMVYSTTNSGQSWISGGTEIVPIGSGIIGLRSLDIIDALTGYVCGFDFGTISRNSYLVGIIYKTTNSGINWFQSFRGDFDFNDLKFKNATTGYASRYSVLKTDNAGNSWQFAAGLTSNLFSISNIFDDTLYLNSDSGRIYKTVNGGFNWTKFYTPINDTLRKSYFINGKIGYVIADNGVIMKTTNGGVNWSLQNSTTLQDLNDIWFINNDTGFVVGDSGVILKTYTGGLVSISNSSSEIPQQFSLYQNYPNPFNPNTIINYQISKPGFISINVYSVLGEVISGIVNKKQIAGNYSVEFEGNNLPSGIYFYSLLVNGINVDTKQMVLLK